MERLQATKPGNRAQYPHNGGCRPKLAEQFDQQRAVYDEKTKPLVDIGFDRSVIADWHRRYLSHLCAGIPKAVIRTSQCRSLLLIRRTVYHPPRSVTDRSTKGRCRMRYIHPR